MPNRLAFENSLYLQQHADNPVDWYPWGVEALSKAKAEDKPIFLSIGYAACHWCHVMAHESFEEPETAAIMNKNYVNIKVDREERPDLDGIYMNAVVAMTGSGGWPTSVFLTPDGAPFYGGTYFPPQRRYNLPSFQEILIAIAQLWLKDRDELLKSAENIKNYIQSANIVESPQLLLNSKIINEAENRLLDSYDWEYGGWGQAPKFPQPMAIEFLLQRATKGNSRALQVGLHVLDQMAKGGMYDVIGGGFSRYSTDNHWLVPHFEKMLYDNAQLALVYLYAFKLTGNSRYRRICEGTLDFILRELSIQIHQDDDSHVGFFSSLDADSEGGEGKYYLWTVEELREVIDDPQDIQLFFGAYKISKEGNFDGRIVLQRILTDDELSTKLNIPAELITNRIDKLHQILLTRRQTRILPEVDDKVLVSWNALTISAFAQAARYLQRDDYLAVAQANAKFLLQNLYQGGRLYRSWRSGKAKHNAYLEDYSGLSLALLDLYQADPANHYWYNKSVELFNSMVAHFEDGEWGFFDTSDDHELLLTRPKDFQDNATPSGNSLAALLLLQLAAYLGEQSLREKSELMLCSVQEYILKYPLGYSKWLCAFQAQIQSYLEIAVIGDLDDARTNNLLAVINGQYRPGIIIAVSPFPPDPTSPPLLFNRPLLNNKPTAYVCRNFVCNQPVNSPEDLNNLL